MHGSDVRISAGALTAVERVYCGDLACFEFKIKNVCILTDAPGLCRFGNYGNTVLEMPAQDDLRRSLSKEASRLAKRVGEVHAKLETHAALFVELEALFSDPGQFENKDHLAVSGEQYRVLKGEEQSLWEEWERLSLAAESVNHRLALLNPKENA